MTNLLRGGAVVFSILGVAALIALWLACSWLVLSREGRETCDNPILAWAIFATPFLAGFCWLVGALLP
jgi:hypothetical protein